MWHASPAVTPGAQLAVSPGRQVMLHAAQVPTAGALHAAPASAFFFPAPFFFSDANAGLAMSGAESSATSRDLFTISSPRSTLQ
jgi:hypothetical protein